MTSLALGCALIGLGLYGALTRRDLIAVLASIEVMLGGSQVLLAAYGAAVTSAATAQAINLLVLAVGAGEASIGLALVIVLVRSGRTRTDDIQEVRG